VYLPLGSESAHGQIGEMMIYQGQWVRRYVVPRDPRTDAQLNTRNLFHDITKTIRSAHAFARAAWAGAYGPRWFPMLSGYCQKDFMGVWSAAVADWAALSEDDRDAWNTVAAFQATYNEPGKIFFAVARINAHMFDVTGWPDFEQPIPDGSNAETILAWWNRELDHALQDGMYDDDDVEFTYDSNWHVETDAGAYGGSYHQQTGGGIARMTFYFCGTGVRFFYKNGAGLGTLQIRIDAEFLNHDLSVGIPGYQRSDVLTGVLPGLHYCIIQWHEFGLINLDAVEVIR